MKRPFLYGAVSMLTALLTWLLGYWFMPVIIVLILMIYNASKLETKKQTNNLILIVIGLICLAYFIYVDVNYKQLKNDLVISQYTSGRAIIKSVDVTDYSTIYGLKPWWDNSGERQDFEVRIIAKDGGTIGDYITFEGDVMKDLHGNNDGAFDLGAYYKTSGIVALIKGDVYVDYHSSKYWLIRYFADVRKDHSSRIHKLIPNRHSSIVDDLLLGLKSVSDADRTLFQTSGTVHILAISGLHVALIAGLLFKCMGFVLYNQKHNAIIVGILTLGYCLYTGAHISTVRATIMILIYLGHKVIYRKYDQHTAIAVAFAWMILVNPLQITSPGFMLSFGAVLSIFYIVPKLFERLPDKYSWLKPLVFITGIQLGIGPLLSFYYGEIPTYSFLGNLLLLPIVTLIISFSSIAIAVSYISMPLAMLIGGSTFWCTNYMLVTVEAISALPGSIVNMPNLSLWLLPVYYSGLAAWLLGRYKVAGLVVLGVFIGLILTLVKPSEALVIDMMDVGNGDACFIQYENQVILIDGGGQAAVNGPNVGEKVLLPYMGYHGIRKLDTVIISHSDYDHVYGIIELMNQVPIDRILLSSVYATIEDPWVDIIKELSEIKDIELIYIESGDSLKIGDLTFQCLYPFDDLAQKDNNSHSSIIHLNLEAFDMLFTGDTYVADELALLGEWPSDIGEIEVLKVAHHGSKTSSSEEFIEFISPDISLVSVSSNNIYGHPAEMVAKRLFAYSDQVYMTKDNGQITITYENGLVKLDTYIK